MKLSLIVCACFFVFNSFSQKVMKIQDAEKMYDKDSLNQKYFDRVFTEEIDTCFDVSQEMFIAEWSKFTRSISKHFHDNNFIWGKKTVGNIEVYFNKEEKVDFFFITIREKDFSEEQYAKMFVLLNSFFKDYKFKIDAKIPFSNAGSITFLD